MTRMCPREQGHEEQEQDCSCSTAQRLGKHMKMHVGGEFFHLEACFPGNQRHAARIPRQLLHLRAFSSAMKTRSMTCHLYHIIRPTWQRCTRAEMYIRKGHSSRRSPSSQALGSILRQPVAHPEAVSPLVALIQRPAVVGSLTDVVHNGGVMRIFCRKQLHFFF